MNRLLKLFLKVGIISIILSMMFVSGASAEGKVSEELQLPKLIDSTISGKGDNDNDETPGEWYEGETPDNIRPKAPVLLFVHGLNSKAQVWWEDNDLPEIARDAGYETAFIQLYDAGGESADMWDNGELLAEKIEEISEHFHGKKITIIAHSKGGIDTQTALSYYGAADYVQDVITLGSPHHGSQLADLAYSSWASWLADLLGAKGDGTEVMQTGYMENFRLEIDDHPLAYENNYYTLGGTSWGDAFSSTWLGGMYLSSYGDSDGVVTVESTKLPKGEEVAIGDWDHSEIRTGVTFSEYEDILKSSSNTENHLSLNHKTKRSNVLNSSQFIRGGKINSNQTKDITFPIEDGNDEVALTFLSASELDDFKIVDPDGKEFPADLKKGYIDESYFQGAYSYYLKIPHPTDGDWKIETISQEDNAYLLIADYQSLVTTNLVQEKGMNGVQYHLNQKSLDTSHIKATIHITSNDEHERPKTFTISDQRAFDQHIPLTRNTLYNITIDIEGKTTSGSPFQRTFIDSIYME